MNARSSIWNNTDKNEKGKIIEDVLLEADVVLLNDGTLTHYHSQSNTNSVIDLALCGGRGCGAAGRAVRKFFLLPLLQQLAN